MLHAEPSFQQPVLVPASCAPTLELQSMFMAIVQPKQCGQLMPALPALPKGMQHLKRVRKRPENEGRLEVLLMPTQSMAEDHSCADGEQGEAREASSSQAASPGIGGELAQLLARLEAAVTEVEVSTAPSASLSGWQLRPPCPANHSPARHPPAPPSRCLDGPLGLGCSTSHGMPSGP